MELVRHVFTRSPHGSLGEPGFQTVACSPGLDKAWWDWLGDLVAKAAPTDGSGGRRHLLHPARQAGRSVLSRIEPLADSFDDRPGNYWAESLVLPNAWLAGAGWDLAAAVDRLDWYGPGQEFAASGVFELPGQTLPELSAGPLDRLRRIPEIVTQPEVRHALLASFAEQAASGGEPAKPIYVVAEGSAPADLEELLCLLPLAFPAWMRARSGDGATRCLRLLTIGRKSAVSQPDLLGLPASQLDEVRGHGVLIDLGLGVPPQAFGGEAMKLAREIDAALVDGDWPRLGQLGSQAAGPDAASRKRERRPEKGETMEEKPKQGRRLERPFEVYDQVWQERAEAEDEVAAVLELLYRDREEVLNLAREEVQRQKEAFRAELKRLREGLRQEIEDGQVGLQETAGKLQSELRAQINRGTAEIQRIADGLGGEHADRHQQLLDDMERRYKEAGQAIDASWKRKQGSLDQAKLKLVNLIEESDPQAVQRMQDLVVSEAADEASGDSRSGGAAKPSWWAKLRSDRRFWIALIGAVAVLLAAWAVWIVVSGTPTSDTPGGDDEVELPPQGEDAAAAQASLRELLQERPVAGAVLSAAAANDRLRSEAAAVWLQLSLGEGVALDDASSCYLLQTAVRREQVRLGAAQVLTVDGGCGAGTQQALAQVAGRRDCRGEWTTQASCLLTQELLAGREGCRLRWPVEPTCRLRHSEASRLLRLVREAHSLAPAMNRAGYDLAFAPALADGLGETLSEGDGDALVPLAFRLERAAAAAGDLSVEPWSVQLTSEQLERTEEHVRRAYAPSPAEQGGGG